MRCSCRGSASVHAESMQEGIAMFVQGSHSRHGVYAKGFVRMTLMTFTTAREWRPSKKCF